MSTDLLGGNWARWAKLISRLHRSRGPKGLGSMPATLLYSAAGVCMQHFMSLFRGRASLCLPRGQYNSWSKHFFIRKQAVIRHCKQEGLQPSLVALFKDCKQPGSKGLLLCIDFSPTSGGGKVGVWRMFLGIWSSTEVAVLKVNYS